MYFYFYIYAPNSHKKHGKSKGVLSLLKNVKTISEIIWRALIPLKKQGYYPRLALSPPPPFHASFHVPSSGV